MSGEWTLRGSFFDNETKVLFREPKLASVS